MRMLPFHSLSNRIWGMLIVMAVGVIISASFIYGIIVRQVEKNYNGQVVQIAHDFMLSNLEGDKNIEIEVDPRILMRTNHVMVSVREDGQFLVKLLNKKPQSLTGDMESIIEQLMAQILSEGITETVYELERRDRENGYFTQAVYGVVDPLSTRLSHQLNKPFGDNTKSYLLTYNVVPIKPIIFFITPRVWVMGLLLLLSTFWIAKIIANSICKPLKTLEAHAFKIANKEWVEALEIDTVDEIVSLVHSVNYMQNQLQKKDEEQKQFLQSISHDLKTPIMVISGHAEAIKDGLYIESLEETADIIINESKRLEAKVSKMLYFNTLDYTLDHSKQWEWMDVETFLFQCIQKFQVLNPTILWEVEIQPVRLRVGKEQLEVALENILDNQLRYARTKISVKLKHDGESVLLTIANDGPPIPEDQISHIFDYLYKGKQGKFGLGLAITQKVIKYFGGSIEVSNEEDGVAFKIRFYENKATKK